MADQDLKREELLEMLALSERENNSLKQQIEQLQQQLESKNIQVQNAGSFAEATISLNSVFEQADRAAI